MFFWGMELEPTTGQQLATRLAQQKKIPRGFHKTQLFRSIYVLSIGKFIYGTAYDLMYSALETLWNNRSCFLSKSYSFHKTIQHRLAANNPYTFGGKSWAGMVSWKFWSAHGDGMRTRSSPRQCVIRCFVAELKTLVLWPSGLTYLAYMGVS